MSEKEEDFYIFSQHDPLAPLKIGEAKVVRAFSKSLTPEEREDCKKYILFLNWPTENQHQRMLRNMAVMCYMDGVRYQRQKGLNALIQTQNNSIT